MKDKILFEKLKKTKIKFKDRSELKMIIFSLINKYSNSLVGLPIAKETEKFLKSIENMDWESNN
jgi:hypothetical protein